MGMVCEHWGQTWGSLAGEWVGGTMLREEVQGLWVLLVGKRTTHWHPPEGATSAPSVPGAAHKCAPPLPAPGSS